jgi:hypothetical protein
MDKNKNKDLDQCKEAWSKKITGELMKRGIKKICDGSYDKGQKTDPHLIECGDSKQNAVIKSESGNEKETKHSIIFPGEKK